MQKRTVYIIGAGGMVGAAAAHALAITETVSDIVLIDVAEDLVRGQAMDISHATAFTKGVHVRVGDYGDLKDNDIVVITCGRNLASMPGKTRRELLDTNVRIVKDVVDNIMQQGKEVFIVMVTNPVDTLTHVALTASGLPPERVFGIGTMCDTARLRTMLAERLHVSQRDIQGYVLGEHGDSSVAALSSSQIASLTAKIPMVWASNYSTGVNTLFWLTRKAAEILGPGYDL